MGSAFFHAGNYPLSGDNCKRSAQLTDNDVHTPAPQAITVSAKDGAAVSAATGETVLIGAGALTADTAVSISRIDINNLQALTGMAAPMPGVLQAVGAFHLDIGSETANYPLQFAIPLQGNPSLSAGDEVYFLQRGTIAGTDGVIHDTWWVMDNGFVGADGIARTASPPYPGFTSSGDILIVSSIATNSQTGAVSVTGSTLNTTFYSPEAGISSYVWNAFVTKCHFSIGCSSEMRENEGCEILSTSLGDPDEQP